MEIEHKQKMVSLLYYLAQADGVYQPQEKKVINEFVIKHSLPAFKLEPADLPSLVHGFTSQDKRMIMDELNVLMRSDGVITSEETEFFAKVSQFLS